jgi:predicted phage terminase large subunit-like protein
MADEFELAAAKTLCQRDHLFFTRYFFKARTGAKFIVNWHHHYICDAIQDVIDCKIKNLIINVPPGSSKTEVAIINFLARGLALNPSARFLHLSYSDDLALLNSQTARDILRSDEYQQLWARSISVDTKSKKRWNITLENKIAGGVYATSLGGQVTGFRAGYMAPGFTGAMVIDDPLKTEDAFSKTKLDLANRRLISTVKSRRANPDIPIVIIMQRIAENDPVGFIKQGNLPGDWKYIIIPALIDDNYVANLPAKYARLVDSSVRDDRGRFSYWEYKEPVDELVAMESGLSVDQSGAQISRQVFSSQYQQNPVAMGGNIFKGKDFTRYKVLPEIRYRKIFADTAQKTKEANDFSVFELWGYGADKKIYLIDMIRGKWEAPELKKRATAFWMKHFLITSENLGQLREMLVEDKSSGTGLIQSIKVENSIPIKPIERNKDKLTRAMDGLPYIEAGLVCVPEDAPFTNDFIAEHEAFTANDSHAHDDQIDPCLDAIENILSSQNKLKQWENLAD